MRCAKLFVMLPPERPRPVRPAILKNFLRLCCISYWINDPRRMSLVSFFPALSYYFISEKQIHSFFSTDLLLLRYHFLLYATKPLSDPVNLCPPGNPAIGDEPAIHPYPYSIATANAELNVFCTVRHHRSPRTGYNIF